MDNINNLMYIVFVLDVKYKEHDGKVFRDVKDAEDFARNYINDPYPNAHKCVLGRFVFNANYQELLITSVKTFGFKGDKNNKQLNLFS